MIGLNVIKDFKKLYSCPIGLSDHSGSIYPGIAALANGANLLEVHIIQNKNSNSPDASSSLNLKELNIICDARDAFFEMHSHPIDKDKMSSRLKNMKKIFCKSVALKKNLSAESIITKNLLTIKKPAFGISPKKINLLIGKKLKKNVSKYRLLKWTDLYD